MHYCGNCRSTNIGTWFEYKPSMKSVVGVIAGICGLVTGFGLPAAGLVMLDQHSYEYCKRCNSRDIRVTSDELQAMKAKLAQPVPEQQGSGCGCGCTLLVLFLLLLIITIAVLLDTSPRLSN